jgi:hypothetical protein
MPESLPRVVYVEETRCDMGRSPSRGVRRLRRDGIHVTAITLVRLARRLHSRARRTQHRRKGAQARAVRQQRDTGVRRRT